MNIPDFYAYLVRARRDLWAFLETLPDEALSRPVIGGERFHCIKDLVLHVAAVEDSWLREDILGDKPIWTDTPGLEDAQDGAHYAQTPLPELLAYWRAVEQSTLAYLARLTPGELDREVTVNTPKGERSFTVSGLLWHVMQHEVRHTAQIALLGRQQGFPPPFLDLLRYLPSR